jgi:Protein of unknown function (DUF4038)/Putative collagen-binding domain of a collagenase
MLSGACGQFFGNNPIWHYDGPGLFPAQYTWHEALDGAGSRDMVRLRQVFERLPWYRLVPEEDHSLVSDGYGSDVATALTARTPDKTLAVTFIASTGAERRALSLRPGQFRSPIFARWYNPTDGRYTAIGEMPGDGQNVQVLRTPGDNGTKTNDWLLILESR